MPQALKMKDYRYASDSLDIIIGLREIEGHSTSRIKVEKLHRNCLPKGGKRRKLGIKWQRGWTPAFSSY